MVAAKLLFQVVGYITVFGGLVGCGIYVNTPKHNTENLFFVFDSPITEEVKSNKFVCTIFTGQNVVFGNPKDNNCQIYKLKTNGSTTTVDLKNVVKKEKITSFVKSKKYILQLNKSVFNDIENINKKISISSAGKELIKFTPKIILGSNIANPTTNLIVVKSFSAQTNAITKNLSEGKRFVCQFSTWKVDYRFDCDLYKHTSDKTNNQFTDKEFSELNKIDITTNIKKNSYFVIDFKKHKLNIDDLRNAKIKVSIAQEGKYDKKVAIFNYEKPLVGDLTTIKDKFAYTLTPNKEIYYVTQLTEASSNIPSKELLETDNLNKKTQNYKCKLDWEENKYDESCQLFSIPNFDTNKKTITFEEIKKTSDLVNKKQQLKKDKYYKLIINHPHLDWTDSSATNVVILPKGQPENTKYGTLKVLAKETGEDAVLKTKHLLVKTPSALTISSAHPSSNIECVFSDKKTNQKNCDIYKFKSEPSATLNFSDLDLTKVIKLKSSADIVSNSYYFVHLKEQDFHSIQDRNKKIKVAKDNNPSLGWLLDIKTPLIGSINFDSSKNNAILLN